MSNGLFPHLSIPLGVVLLIGLPAPRYAPWQAPPAQTPGASAGLNTKPYTLDALVFEEPKLPDLAGQARALFTENEGKALLLVFWSRKDPVSRYYLKALTELQRTRAEKLTVVLVNSNYNELVSGGDPLAKMRETIAADKVTLPVLLDHGNKLADDFRATANAQVFLIDANRFLRYHGGIDDDPDGERSKKKLPRNAWLEVALDQVLAGERPKENWTRPAGLPIKRAPKNFFGPAGGAKKQ
ncbi:MAG: redoxin domain-containing protein [Planctomycetes bacterium]|nr:redoxin domain-containing protein [Planctomycetota bacterium]